MANASRIPTALRHDADEIFKLTDGFCTEHLDEEYGRLCRALVARLARKRPSPLASGELRIWAAAVIYAVGGINFLFDRTQSPHLTADDLSHLTGVPKSTLANKAKRIRDTLRLGMYEPDLTRRALLEQHPLTWMISVNGLLVDARTLPRELQVEAKRLGLIPDVDM